MLLVFETLDVDQSGMITAKDLRIYLEEAEMLKMTEINTKEVLN